MRNKNAAIYQHVQTGLEDMSYRHVNSKHISHKCIDEAQIRGKMNAIMQKIKLVDVSLSVCTFQCHVMHVLNRKRHSKKRMWDQW